MIGCSEAGLAEVIDFVLKMFKPEEQLLLANNVFLTGGCSKFPGNICAHCSYILYILISFAGLKDRLSRELLEMRPFQTPHKITLAKSATLDGWHGAREFAASSGMLKKNSITRAEYNELGGEYFKEFYASNKYCPTPAVTTQIPEI